MRPTLRTSSGQDVGSIQAPRNANQNRRGKKMQRKKWRRQHQKVRPHNVKITGPTNDAVVAGTGIIIGEANPCEGETARRYRLRLIVLL